MTSISDLPTEIVVEVTSHLAAFDDDTYRISLALTCRRFYNTIIHSVLVDQIKEIEKLSSHSRIFPPLYNSTDGSRIGPSSEVVLFQRKFNNIRFIVGDMTRKELRSLQCFVCRSDRLRRVEIHLLATKLCSLKDVARFIGTCTAKPDLSLRIAGGISGRLESPFCFHFHPPNDANSKPSIKTDTTSPVESPRPTFYSVTRRKNDFNENSFLKAQLDELSLDGEFPFLLPIYPVIINCLSSPITTLSISGVPPSVTLFHWNQILPSITLPNLKNLTLEKLLIAFPDLLAFLERHQTIRTLDLTEKNVIGVLRLPPRAFLPRLFSLTANAEYLLPFIQHKKQGYFPSLEFLYANPCGSSRNPDELLPLYASLSEQGHHFKLCLGIAAKGTIGLIQWLLDADHSSRNKPTNESSSPTSTPLACVRQLTLSNPNLSTSPEISMRLSKRFDDRYVSLREMLDEDELMFTANSEKLIEVLLWTTCLQLTSVKIGSRESTRDWMTSHHV